MSLLQGGLQATSSPPGTALEVSGIHIYTQNHGYRTHSLATPHNVTHVTDGK